MINLPSQLTPSELLCHEEVSPFIDKLLQSSCLLRKVDRLLEAERCAQDAVMASQEPGDNVSRAMALIYLADVRREMNKLEPALVGCREAYPIFRRQVSRYQRHNGAVAAYALGLVCQLLGNEMDALKWYQESGEQFEKIKNNWVADNAKTQVKICTCIQHWMGILSEYLIAARIRAHTDLTIYSWIPIIPPDTDVTTCIGMLIIPVPTAAITDGIGFTEMSVVKTITGESLRVKPLKQALSTSLLPDIACYALKIPDESLEFLGASEEDYVQIVRKQVVQARDPDREGLVVREALGRLEFGNLKRDINGQISFIRSNVMVIGGEDIDWAGYITALLSPTVQPSESSPPTPAESSTSIPSESSSPTSLESSIPVPLELSADPTELYSQLLYMVGGDRGIADRLIEYEHQRTPDASPSTLIDRAIAHWIRDNQ